MGCEISCEGKDAYRHVNKRVSVLVCALNLLVCIIGDQGKLELKLEMYDKADAEKAKCVQLSCLCAHRHGHCDFLAHPVAHVLYPCILSPTCVLSARI